MACRGSDFAIFCQSDIEARMSRRWLLAPFFTISYLREKKLKRWLLRVHGSANRLSESEFI